MIKAMDLSLLFVAVFLAIVLIGLMALSRRSLIASLIASVISLGFSGFFVFGFMACYEPSNSLVRLWQLAYAVFSIGFIYATFRGARIVGERARSGSSEI